MACADEVLKAVKAITRLRKQKIFTIKEVREYVMFRYMSSPALFIYTHLLNLKYSIIKISIANLLKYFLFSFTNKRGRPEAAPLLFPL